MTVLSRREFSQQTLGSLLTFSLLQTVFSHEAFCGEIVPITGKWLQDVNELSKDMRGGKIKQTEWQEKLEQLMEQVDLPELLKYIHFEKLIEKLEFSERGERAIQHKLPEVEGLPTELVFGHQIFALKKDRSVVPHGHNNMATAFLILQGDFHGRHYDRLEDPDDDHMIIQPTIDRSFEAGGFSTISDHKDNVHWFRALSETAFIFNIHVVNIDPKNPLGGRVYIDPDGEKLSGGRIRAVKLTPHDAHEKYG
jgi:hypothetical protein